MASLTIPLRWCYADWHETLGYIELSQCYWLHLCLYKKVVEDTFVKIMAA